MPHPERLDPYGVLRGSLEHLDGRVEFHLFGEIDLANADAVQARVLELAQLSPGDVILDLGELEFLGSVGLRSFLRSTADSRPRVAACCCETLSPRSSDSSRSPSSPGPDRRVAQDDPARW